MENREEMREMWGGGVGEGSQAEKIVTGEALFFPLKWHKIWKSNWDYNFTKETSNVNFQLPNKLG